MQRAVLVPALEGRDIIARAKTGTGKTLAFGIPIIKQLTEEDEQRGPHRYLHISFLLNITILKSVLSFGVFLDLFAGGLVLFLEFWFLHLHVS